MLSIFINVIVVLQNFVKLLSFIRLSEEFGFLVTMISVTLVDLAAFLMYFLLWNIVFMLGYFVFRIELDENDLTRFGIKEAAPHISANQYNLSRAFRLFFFAFNNSLANFKNPDMTFWTRPHIKDAFVMYLVWMWWVCNAVIMVVVILNFIIAVISESYVNVMELKQQYSFTDKSDINKEYFELKQMFYKEPESI